MIKLIKLLVESIQDDHEDWDYPEYSNEYEKITPETLKKIKETDRIVLSTEDTLDLSRKIPPSSIGRKPIGLWYGFGTSWIDFIRAEMPDRETQHVFKIEVDDMDIYNINQEKMFLWFSQRFKDPKKEGKYGNYKIDWPEVSKKTKGIEIPIYFRKYSRDPEHDWYSTWDVESGCIWDLSAIKKVEKLQ